MRRGRAVLVFVCTTAMVLGLSVPGGAVVTSGDHSIVLPPPTDEAPHDALYVEPRFSPSLTWERAQYGAAVNVDGELQELHLDVYEPDGHDDEFRPVVVWAPGGGFTRVSSNFRFLRLVQRGYVGVYVNEYRVRPDMPHGFEDFTSPEGAQSVAEGEPIEAVRDAQHDMQAAVRWVRANAEHLRVDPTRIVASGYSAGAAMAWAAAYNHHDPGDSGNPDWDSHVAAGLSGAGGYIVGPQGLITPGLPPIVAFHGTHDTTVPMASSTAPCALTLALGNVCEHHVYPEETHGLPRFDAEAADFLWRHVLTADRVESTFTDLSADGDGGTATASGRLIDEDGEPLAEQRVLARATAGWNETTTDEDGAFSLEVDAPDHGRSAQVQLRYHGHSEASWLDGPTIAPATTSVTATWGGGRVEP